MRALNRKLLRDLLRMRSQAAAIAAVVAAGVAVSVLGLCNLETLSRSRDSFYRDTRFADVFLSVKRAPVLRGAPAGRRPRGCRRGAARCRAGSAGHAGGQGAGFRSPRRQTRRSSTRLRTTSSFAGAATSNPPTATRCLLRSRSPMAHRLQLGEIDSRHHQRASTHVDRRRCGAVSRVHLRHRAGRALP